MKYIIDGHNLISKIPGLSLSMPDDEERLIELLSRFSEGSRHKLEVFFDGAPAGQVGERTYGKVRAHFVPARLTADEAIRKQLAKLGRSAADWVVVTSDRAVQSAAREQHARVVSSGEFAALVEETLEARIAKVNNTSDQPLSEAEVNEWLAIFRSQATKK